MKIFFPVFFLAFLLLGCNKDDEDTFEYDFFVDARIVVDEFGFSQIESGENLVFQYDFTKSHDPNIADDEFSERVIFEIPADLESFSYTDEDLKSINAYYDKYCFCLIEGSIQIERGQINGNKIDENRWNVSINIEFEDFGTITKTINGPFTRTSL